MVSTPSATISMPSERPISTIELISRPVSIFPPASVITELQQQFELLLGGGSAGPSDADAATEELDD